MNILLLHLRVQNWRRERAPGAAAIVCGRFRKRKRVTIPRTPQLQENRVLLGRVFSVTLPWFPK